MKTRKSRVALLLISAAAAGAGAACSGGGSSGGNVSQTPPVVTQPPGGSFDPLKIGNNWHYDVTVPGVANTTKTVTVASFEDIGGQKTGTAGFRLDTTQSNGPSQKEWHTDSGSVELRQRRQDFDATGALKTDTFYVPSKTYVDETTAHTAGGASWTENYQDQSTDAATGIMTPTSHTITWTVLSTNDSITVTAGTFPCLSVRRVSTPAGSGSDKTFWFSQGVGKVKEVDTDPANPSGTPLQTEALTAYTVN